MLNNISRLYLGIKNAIYQQPVPVMSNQENNETSEHLKDSILTVLQQFQSDTLTQQSKTTGELKEDLQKFMKTYLDDRLKNLELEVKTNQAQQFSDMKNHQKLFHQQMQNNSKKKEALNLKFDEIKEDSRKNFEYQGKKSDKQYENLQKQCNEMKTAIAKDFWHPI